MYPFTVPKTHIFRLNLSTVQKETMNGSRLEPTPNSPAHWIFINLKDSVNEIIVCACIIFLTFIYTWESKIFARNLKLCLKYFYSRGIK